MLLLTSEMIPPNELPGDAINVATRPSAKQNWLRRSH